MVVVVCCIFAGGLKILYFFPTQKKYFSIVMIGVKKELRLIHDVAFVETCRAKDMSSDFVFFCCCLLLGLFVM